MPELEHYHPGTWEFPGESTNDMKRPVTLFICDIQSRFRSRFVRRELGSVLMHHDTGDAITNFDRVVTTGAKMLKAAKVRESLCVCMI